MKRFSFLHNSRCRKIYMRFSLFLTAFLVLASSSAFAQTKGTGQLKAGTAKVDISPKTVQNNRKVHDALYARSLILDDGTTRIGFLSLDLGGYTNPALMASLKKKFRLNELYFCPSHTHSGATDRDLLEGRITKLFEDASASMFEAKISGGQRKTPPLAFDRLILRDDGHAREAWYADPEGHFLYCNTERLVVGDVDPYVGVIRIDDKSGNPKVLIMNFACHPDALVEARSIVSADYVGAATKYTEAAFDNKVNCLFVQGGAGNQCSIFKTPTDGRTPENYIAMVERMGKLLGIETVALAKELYPNPYDEQSIKLKTDSIDMPNRFDSDVARAYFSTILINKRFAIATFPGEPFIKFQIDWKREMGPYAVPFFFGYTWNGGKWPTYVPDVRSAALGGYGADWGPVRAPESGEALMTRQMRNYYEISGLMRKTQGPGDHRLDNGTVIWTPDWMKPKVEIKEQKN